MTFVWPWLLLLLPLIPTGLGLLMLLDARRARQAALFGHLRLGGMAPPARVVFRRRIVAAFFLAGLVIHEAHTIPNPGQAFTFHGYRFEVLRRQRNRLTSLQVTPLAEKVAAKAEAINAS